jgi:hypothetical protein
MVDIKGMPRLLAATIDGENGLISAIKIEQQLDHSRVAKDGTPNLRDGGTVKGLLTCPVSKVREVMVVGKCKWNT